jgi:asparagine synthase (glutamine-hydrolysing)
MDGFFEDADCDLEKFVAPIEKHLDDIEVFSKKVPIFNGHYAISVVGNENNITYLITDPFGSRPIYYAETSRGWVWGFQVRQIVKSLDRRSLDIQGLDEFFIHQWLMEDRTLLSGVNQVLPSHVVCLETGKPPLVRRYARLDFCPSSGEMDLEHAVNLTDRALSDYFERIRKSHACISILFSGGVDSSLLLAKAKEFDFERLFAVTAHFPGHENPEIKQATAIAEYLKVELRIVEVPDSFIRDFTPDLVWQLERPPAYLNSFARAKIFHEVSSDAGLILSGEVADCMFSSDIGVSASRYERKRQPIKRIPNFARRSLASILKRLDSSVARKASFLLTSDAREYVRQYAEYNKSRSDEAISKADLAPTLRQVARQTKLYAGYEPNCAGSIFSFSQNRTLYTSNRNQYYHYSQLAAPHRLNVSLPFMSREIANIGLALPDALKWDRLGAKPVLKSLATRYIPAHWVHASKQGFVSPDSSWISGPLSTWRAILLDERSAARGIFDHDILQRLETPRDNLLLLTATMLEIYFRQFHD